LNLNEAIELLNTVSDFDFEDSKNSPKISIFCNKNNDCKVCIYASLVGAGYRNYLEGIVKLHRLNIRESDGYLVIHG
jgi:hypothetical protein